MTCIRYYYLLLLDLIALSEKNRARYYSANKICIIIANSSIYLLFIGCVGGKNSSGMITY